MALRWVLQRLFAVGFFRRVLWRIWYRILTWFVHAEDVTFLNYAFEDPGGKPLSLSEEDEASRPNIQLYDHVVTQPDKRGHPFELHGKAVLEVSCGHGGGASWLVRTLSPACYIGFDLNPKGIEFCRRRHQGRHQLECLTFLQGDAEAMPFPDACFDAVVNVEASHCYPDFPKFLREVERVLRPGGVLLYADFRWRSNKPRFAEWEGLLGQGVDKLSGALGLLPTASSDISAEVLRGLRLTAPRSTGLIERLYPRWMQGLAHDFAGTPGSKINQLLEQGEVVYRSYRLDKPAVEPTA